MMDMQQGQVTFDGPMVSFGKVDVRSGTMSLGKSAAGKEHIIGGQGLDVSDGGKIELMEGSVVGFSNVTSTGLIDVMKNSSCTFASIDMAHPTTIKGEGLRTAASSSMLVAAGIVNVDAPLQSKAIENPL